MLRSSRLILSFAVLSLSPAAGIAFAAGPPLWAYGYSTPPPPPGAPVELSHGAGLPPVPDTRRKHIDGSTAQFTDAQIADGFGPADWFPGDHPTMPEIVARGRKPELRACALCHYPNGKGRSENAGVSGLPVSYFIQTINDFRNGLRKSADPRKGNTFSMIAIAKGMTDDEVKAAAEYFGSMKWSPWMKVIETKDVPKTRLVNGMFLKLEGKETEPIGQRVIETPIDTEATQTLKNPRSGFEVYVPIGAIKKGEALVKMGAGKTVACGVCHGEDLKGMGPLPGLAGRSPSYLGRQLYDMQSGFRKGPWTELMKPVVARLTEEDIVNIVAYTASLEP